jgi:Helicase conserved C-terminal domain
MGVIDDLRALSADDMARLLTARPELADPPPSTLTDLANRASAPYSIQRCLSMLNLFDVQVLHGVVLLSGATLTGSVGSTAANIAALAHDVPPVSLIEAELHRLQLLGLVGVRSGLWTISAPVSRMLGRPFGLGELLEHSFDRHSPADLRVIAENLGLSPVVGKVGLIRQVAGVLRDPVQLTALLGRLPADTVSLLTDSIADGVSLVTVPGLMQRSRVSIEAAQLLSHGLLVPLDWDLAEIPREISLQQTAGKPLRAYDLAPPPISGGGAPTRHEELLPTDVVGYISRMVYLWKEQPAALLRAGGIGITVLKTLAKELGVEQPLAARLIALAGAAGLVGVDLAHDTATVTQLGDDWIASDAPQKWVTLVEGWRTATHDIARVADEEHPVAPLRVDNLTPDSAWRRGRLLAALAGATYDGFPDPASLLANVLWDGPSRWTPLDSIPSRVIDGLLGDMAMLGLFRNGSLTPAAKALLDGDPLELLRLASAGFPAPLDTFTVQGDLTAIAPGELREDIAAELAVLADIESRGGATMLRFSETSIRRSMDRGRTQAGIIEFLERHAKPTVPQTLRVLVSDVERRHGQLRSGPAVSYLRADDEATLAAVVNSKKLSKARLRLLAPTVAISSMDSSKLVKLMRDAGFSPMPEDALGNLISVASENSGRKVFARNVAVRFNVEVERSWTQGIAGADVSALQPTIQIRKLADRLKAGRN